ncbi:Membrane protease YdiL, CAAX protease family [Plantibacter flavus]|uniref:Membrane protease YdiL (CAAX protease family) n=1 Tax=Plantibacter flavus TaxID=150123 RepID=A0A3N2BLA3_9MICO|nr:type II CAAX endopeptidase family protein [Plantibacter flavus]ROR76045.1 membrane protease YdiL (CAAX protease family) [Plantibacter flavus]SMG49025.1 Membrane protease YdiL, CAAX protease family [Plantibacter flavus]
MTGAWARTVLVLAGSLAIYVATALLGTVLTGDAIAGAAISNLAVFILALALRWRRTGTPLAPPPQFRARSISFWAAAAFGLVVCWLLGQTAAALAYDTFGSPAFDAANAAKAAGPIWLLLLTSLFLAPLGEESLIRGIAYPVLRRHWPPLASAFVTSMVFALLHGNLVQIALTIPLGMVLAAVYEATERLWPVIIMHVIFNMTSTFVPRSFIEGISRPAVVVALIVATGLVLFALSPARYRAEGLEVEKSTGHPAG